MKISAMMLCLFMATIAWFGSSRSAAASTCTVSVGNIAFSSVDTLGTTPSDASATIQITCDSLLGVSMCPNIGAGSGGTASDGSRLLTGAGTPLRYQLYQDAARTTVWGTGTNAPLITLPSGRASTTRTLYARVFAGQSIAAPGTFTSVFSGTQTAFTHGEVTILNCGVTLLGNTERPSFTVSATLAANCLISADDLNFGMHGLLTQPVSAAGALRVNCTPGTNYAIGMNGGTSGATDPTQRLMRANGRSVRYGLYRDANHTLPWSATGTGRLTGTGNGSQVTLGVYGLVPAQTTPPAATYSDTIIVTITYGSAL